MNTTIETAVQDFLVSRQVNGASPATLRSYRYHLESVIKHFRGVPIDQITAAMLREFIQELRGRTERWGSTNRPTTSGGLSYESIRGHIRSTRIFFRWAYLEYDIEPRRNPMLKIPLPGRQNQEPKAILLEDVKALLKAADTSVRGIRDKAIVAFLADTGCRAAGITGLKVEKLNLVERYAIVHEKGSKDRRVPFTAYTAGLLREWLFVRPGNSDCVFVALGTNTTGNPLTLTGLNMVLRRLKEMAGVKGRCNPHSFRHAFAREYLLNGGDLATLSALMGHSDVNVTVAYYARFKDRELAEQHDKFSPMAGMEDAAR